jgi:hypothetical protein
MFQVKLVNVPAAAREVVVAVIKSHWGRTEEEANKIFSSRNTSPIHNFANPVDPDVHAFCGRLVEALAPWPGAGVRIGKGV